MENLELESWLKLVLKNAEMYINTQNKGKTFKIDQANIMANCRAIDEANQVFNLQVEIGIIKDPNSENPVFLKITKS